MTLIFSRAAFELQLKMPVILIYSWKQNRNYRSRFYKAISFIWFLLDLLITKSNQLLTIFFLFCKRQIKVIQMDCEAMQQSATGCMRHSRFVSPEWLLHVGNNSNFS